MRPETKSGARIEGGIDAVVLGGSFEALAAAALLAQKGYRTVLVENGGKYLGTDREEIAPGFFCDRPEELLWRLDNKLVNDLDLYRFGFAYAERRLETVFHLSNQTPLIFGGDPLTAHERDELLGPEDAEELRTFFVELIGGGARLNSAATAAINGPQSDIASITSQDAVSFINRSVQDDGLRAAFLAEACLRADFRPTDAYSALALLFRYNGDVSGLRGALGVHSDGVRGLWDALRRAAQSFGVEFRRTADVAEVIVERDCVAGVQFADGGQLRAPVVVSAHDAKRAFLEHVGRSQLDIEFVHRLESPKPQFGYLRAHVAVNDVQRLKIIDQYPRARHVGVPSRHDLAGAFRAAREGGSSDQALIELFVISNFVDGVAPANGALLTVTFGPVAALLDEEQPSLAERNLRKSICRLLGTEDDCLTALVFDLHPGRQTPVKSAMTAALVSGANKLSGYFFCGPESLFGDGLSGTAGRQAAEKASDFLKNDRGGQ